MTFALIYAGIVVVSAAWFAYEIWRAPLVPDDHPWVTDDEPPETRMTNERCIWCGTRLPGFKRCLGRALGSGAHGPCQDEHGNERAMIDASAARKELPTRVRTSLGGRGGPRNRESGS